MISPSRREELLRLAEKATKGKWRFSPWHIEEDNPCIRIDNWGIVATASSDADAAYIAACDPQTIIALLTLPSREEIARLISPVWFTEYAESLNNYPDQHKSYQKAAYETADAILALFHKAPTAENTDG